VGVRNALRWPAYPAVLSGTGRSGFVRDKRSVLGGGDGGAHRADRKWLCGWQRLSAMFLSGMCGIRRFGLRSTLR
jgi:hypothetical protein